MGEEEETNAEQVTAEGPKAEETEDQPSKDGPVDRSNGSMPDPSSLMGDSPKENLPEVEQLGTISLETLNSYNCHNTDRRLMCLFGVVYDVTSAPKKYGPDGSYAEFAGHDITLTLGAGQMGDKWLDKYVKYDSGWKEGAEKWVDYYASKYPKCGFLDKWSEDPDSWPEPTPEEREALNSKCIIL
jgi:Cytochrome b5-like Heme/Steroid binding domain